eukprot:363597-Chlamydomonas_euryale.AAC.9
MEPLSGLHVYSVAPKQQLDTVVLWQHDHLQAHELLRMVQEGDDSASADAFKRNACSAVNFTPKAARTAVPRAASPEPELPAVAAPRPAPLAVQPSHANTAPAASTAAAKPGAAAKKGDGVAGKPNALASMWGKSAAKPAGTKPATPAPQPVPAAADSSFEAAAAAAAAAATADADAYALPDAGVAAASKRPRRVVRIADSDDDDNGGSDAGIAAGSVAGAGGALAANRTTHDDAPAGAEEHERMERNDKVDKPKAKRGREKKGGAADPEPGAANGNAGEPAGSATRTHATPAVFAAVPTASSGKRRRVLRTTINDDGEEVTEEVWETAAGSEDAPVAAAQPPLPASPPDAKPAPARAASPAKPAGKKSGGGGPAKGQRNITSFFRKG